MNNSKKYTKMIVPMVLAASLLGACNPIANAPSTSATTQTGVSTTQSTRANQASIDKAIRLQANLASVQQEEALFKDTWAMVESDMRANASGSFSTKQANAGFDLIQSADAGLTINDNVASLTQDLEANGALNLQADASEILNTDEFRSRIMSEIAVRKSAFMSRVQSIRAKLNDKKAAVRDKVNTLIHKDFEVRVSDEIAFQNTDGSVTQMAEVEFKKNGLQHTAVIAATSQGDAFKNIEFMITGQGSAFNSEGMRILTFNADNTQTLLLENMADFKGGIKQAVIQARSIGADGMGTGVGTLELNQGNISQLELLDTTIDGEGMLNASIDLADGVTLTTAETLDGNANIMIVANNETESTSSLDLTGDFSNFVDLNAAVDGSASTSLNTGTSTNLNLDANTSGGTNVSTNVGVDTNAGSANVGVDANTSGGTSVSTNVGVDTNSGSANVGVDTNTSGGTSVNTNVGVDANTGSTGVSTNVGVDANTSTSGSTSTNTSAGTNTSVNVGGTSVSTDGSVNLGLSTSSSDE